MSADASRIAATRIIEALVIGGITAGVSIYAATQVLSERMDAMKAATHELRAAMEAQEHRQSTLGITFVRLDEALKRTIEKMVESATQQQTDVARLEAHLNTVWPRLSHAEYDILRMWQEIEHMSSRDMGDPRVSKREPVAQ